MTTRPPVAVSLLSASEAGNLKRQSVTYAAVGATASGPPAGFDTFTLARVLNHTDLDAAAHDLMSWRVQQRAGLKVAASSPTVAPDAVVVMRLGISPLALRIPCRVIYVVDRPETQGFAYGTLPGHPETGEESFLLSRRPDGRVQFTVSAFSKPATPLARLGGPVSRWLQATMTQRYLRSLDR